MKLMKENKIASVSSSASHLSSTYAVNNVLNDVPSLGYIANAASATLTVSAASGVQAFFLSGLMADSATITVSDGTYTSSAYSLNTTKLSSLNDLNDGQEFLLSAEWMDFSLVGGSSIQNNDSGTTLGSTTTTIALSSSSDLKGSPVSGNAIANWSQSSGVAGNFEDSSNVVVSVADHGNVRLGSLVTIGGSTYQVAKIKGDGTVAGDIELTSSVGSAAVTAIKNPIKLGILRAGAYLSIEDPGAGFSNNFTDHSIRIDVDNGRFLQTPRNTNKFFQGSSITTDANVRSFENFFQGIRSKPFPVLMVEGLASSFETTTRQSAFVCFVSPPQFVYSERAAVSSVSYQFREVL